MTDIKDPSGLALNEDTIGERSESLYVNTQMNFDSFVPDEGNLSVFQMAILMSENGMSSPESSALFIYGAKGVGKSHLLTSISLASNNLTSVLVTGSSLKEHWDQAIKKDANPDLGSDLVEPDLLIIDDLHITQENEELHREILTIIQMRLDANLGVVASANVPPAGLDLSDVSFSSSLKKESIVQLSLGAWRTRLEILKRFIVTSQPLPEQPLIKTSFNLNLNGHDLRDIGHVFSSRPDILQLLWGLGYELNQIERKEFRGKGYLICQWKKIDNGRNSMVDLAYSIKSRGVKVRVWSTF